MEDSTKADQNELTENAVSEQSETKAGRKKAKSGWRDTAETVLGAILIALITRGAVAEPRYIPSGSMQPTLEINDRLIIEKISNYTQEIQRGDILVFYPPDEQPKERGPVDGTLRWLGLTNEEAYIKRVVGLPGESVAVHDGKVFVNGKALSETYIKEAPAYDMAPVKVPTGNLFMMGDNRNNSRDSHVWGPLPVSNVIGHASFRFWPPARVGGIH